MYNNIGKKIKGAAIGMAILIMVGGLVTGISLMCADEDLIIVGLPIILVSPLVGYVFSWFIYAFGDIVDKLTQIEINTRGAQQPAQQYQYQQPAQYYQAPAYQQPTYPTQYPQQRQ